MFFLQEKSLLLLCKIKNSAFEKNFRHIEFSETKEVVHTVCTKCLSYAVLPVWAGKRVVIKNRIDLWD